MECRSGLNELQAALVVNSMLCAQWTNGEHDISNTDSGSPLVSDNHLTGLALWSTRKQSGQNPRFIRIDHFIDWIDQQIRSI